MDWKEEKRKERREKTDTNNLELKITARLEQLTKIAKQGERLVWL
jgi:hypothetical protein